MRKLTDRQNSVLETLYAMELKHPGAFHLSSDVSRLALGEPFHKGIGGTLSSLERVGLAEARHLKSNYGGFRPGRTWRITEAAKLREELPF
jgi:hypothetical protein